MKVLIILAHPRNKTSMTRQISDSFAAGLEKAGNQVDTLNLFDLKFNPIMYEQDEPKHEIDEQQFTEQVHAEMERLSKYDALVFAFPLYWFHLPAILKGYVDRVFNYTYAYGRGAHLKHQKILWLTVAGASEAQLESNNMKATIENSFNVGIAGFCKVEKSKVKFFYETKGNKPHIKDHLPDAYQEGLKFNEW